MNLQLGLVGYPLGHSLSPTIHKAAMDACDLEGDYSLFPVHPADLQGLKELLSHVRTGELTGLNVTIPHKQNVIPLLDELTPTARAIGAANTILMQAGNLTGDNTDVPGFLIDLQKFLSTRKSHLTDTKSALVLGAGGSARAVLYALLQDGWSVSVAARRLEQAQTIRAHFPDHASRIRMIEYIPDTLSSLLPALDLVVNATPVGMFPHIDASPWPAGLSFPRNVSVYDLVYNPRETKLVKAAGAAGLPATSGLGMLIEQAALAFEIWTGCSPLRDDLKSAVH